MQSARVDHAQIEETMKDGLWAIFNLILQSEQLEAWIEHAREQVEAFNQTVDDPPPTEAEERLTKIEGQDRVLPLPLESSAFTYFFNLLSCKKRVVFCKHDWPHYLAPKNIMKNNFYLTVFYICVLAL